jgi:hypothetical protein
VHDSLSAALAAWLQELEAEVVMHDPYVAEFGKVWKRPFGVAARWR